MPMFLVARSVLVRSTKCNQMHVVSCSVSCFCSVCSVCCPTGCRYLLQGWWISTCHAAWRLWQQIMTYLRLIMVDQYILAAIWWFDEIYVAIYVRFVSIGLFGTLYDAQHMVTKCRVNTEKCRPANAEFGKNARWVPRKTTCFVYNWWIPLWRLARLKDGHS